MKPTPFNRRQLLRQTGAWALGTGALGACVAHAAVFLQAEEAMRLLLPAAEQFDALDLHLGPGELARIAELGDVRVPKNFAPRVWSAQAKGQRQGWVVTDRVIGKYDLIDFAAGFDARGVALGMEILAYRESHGGEVRQASWRQQFKGRPGPKAMRFGDDIRNISGATLSCQHVTEGMQRLSALVSLLT
jgi:hypothetical protein